MLTRGALAQDASPRGNSVQKSPHDNALDSLVSANRTVRQEAVRQLDTERFQLIRQLSAILDSTNADAVRADAAIVLGEYRVAQAVPYLVHHFELDDVYPRLMGGASHMSREMMAEASLPVSSALYQIGLPAIPALLDRIVETDDTNITAKCVLVCWKIEGRDLTQHRLQELKELAADHKKNERIQSAMDILKNVDARINTAGAPELLYTVAEEDHADMRDFIVEGCVGRQGHEMTQLQLERLLEKETDPIKKARIQSALDTLEKSNPVK